MWDRAVKREGRSTQKRLMGFCAERQQDERVMLLEMAEVADPVAMATQCLDS